MDDELACLEPEEIKALTGIWVRARTRAFAHDFAAKRLRRISQRRFACEVALTFLSLGLLIMGYFATQAQFLEKPNMRSGMELVGNLFFLASILASLVATYIMLTSHRTEIMGIQSRHKMMVRSFMQISQKVRRMEAHVYDPLYYKFLISFLNDQVEGLVTTGESPSDDDYNLAHRQMDQLKRHKDKDIRHSFVPGTEEEEIIAGLPLEIEPISTPKRPGLVRRTIGYVWRAMPRRSGPGGAESP